MSVSINEEKRVLSKAEFDIVKLTHVPYVDELDEKELADLASQLRRYRDKARDISRRQRREVRGKAEPRGAKAAAGNDNQTYKKQIFASALKRANRRRSRLENEEKRQQAYESAKTALKRKNAAVKTREGSDFPSTDQTPNKGPRKITSRRRTVPINPMERGRVSQFVRDAQAKKDS